MEKCISFMLYLNLSLKCLIYLQENKVKFCRTDILIAVKDFLYVRSRTFMNQNNFISCILCKNLPTL